MSTKSGRVVVRGVCEYCGVTTKLESDGPVRVMTPGSCRRCSRPVVLRPGRGLKAPGDPPVFNTFHPNQQ